MESSSLTQYERSALAATFNLADGHARSRSPLALEYVERALALLTKGSLEQELFDYRFSHAFEELLGQRWERSGTCRFVLPSASTSLEIMANVARLQGMAVLAPEPCFDNLVSILKRHGVPVAPYDGDAIDLRRRLDDQPAETSSLAVLLVAPGNPLGTLADSDSLQSAIEACAKAGASVLLDASFRAYSESLCRTDTYAALVDSGVSFLACEDTGKFLPMHELKASPLICDIATGRLVAQVYDDFMIGHSPLVLSLISDVFESIGQDLLDHARKLVNANRINLLRAVRGTFRDITRAPTSVAWIETRDGRPSSHQIAEWKAAGVHVLPGKPFYWSGKADTAVNKIRVALMREHTYFDAGVRRIAAISEGLHA